MSAGFSAAPRAKSLNRTSTRTLGSTRKCTTNNSELLGGKSAIVLRMSRWLSREAATFGSEGNPRSSGNSQAPQMLLCGLRMCVDVDVDVDVDKGVKEVKEVMEPLSRLRHSHQLTQKPRRSLRIRIHRRRCTERSPTQRIISNPSRSRSYYRGTPSTTRLVLVRSPAPAITRKPHAELTTPDPFPHKKSHTSAPRQQIRRSSLGAVRIWCGILKRSSSLRKSGTSHVREKSQESGERLGRGRS